MLMRKQLLERTKRNEIFELLRKNSFDPPEFKWTETKVGYLSTILDPGIVSTLVHTPTGYQFSFGLLSGCYRITFSPGREYLESAAEGIDWNSTVELVQNWLSNLRQEIEAPNLWAEKGQYSSLIEAVTSETENDTFSAKEQACLLQALTEIKDWLFQQQNIQQDHAAFVTRRFEYLESAVSRMSRIDWLHTTVGVFFTVTVGIGLAPATARELFRVALDSLSRVAGDFLRLLPS